LNRGQRRTRILCKWIFFKRIFESNHK